VIKWVTLTTDLAFRSAKVQFKPRLKSTSAATRKLVRCRSYFGRFLPARRYASVGNSDRNVSVCLSVTSRYFVKTKKASVMISSPPGSPKILVRFSPDSPKPDSAKR